MKNTHKRYVKRLMDGKVLPVVDECGDYICVEEMFEFEDSGPSPRPLKIWHPMSMYAPYKESK